MLIDRTTGLPRQGVSGSYVVSGMYPDVTLTATGTAAWAEAAGGPVMARGKVTLTGGFVADAVAVGGGTDASALVVAPGGSLVVQDGLTLVGAGLSVGAGSVAQFGQLTLDGGSVATVDAAGSVEVGSAVTDPAAGTVTVDVGGVLSLRGGIVGPLVDNGLVFAAGRATVSGVVSGTGLIAFGPATTLGLSETGGVVQMGATLAGLTPDDVIAVAGPVAVTGAAYAAGVLTLTGAGGVMVGQLAVAGVPAGAAFSVTAQADGSSGVSLVAPARQAFDAGYYLAQNPDVAAAGVDPFVHYMTTGWMEGRNPSAAFDTRDYLAANPDVAAAGSNPLQEFVGDGVAQGRVAYAVSGGGKDPLVDAAYYYRMNADVKAAGADASAHYLAHGWAEGRNPDALFDSSFYLQQNPDVAAAGMDPLVHFETFGWKEGRDPSLAFSDSKYLAANPDVAAAGVNPLLHYLANGMSEGRMAFLGGGSSAADPLVDSGFYDRQLGATIVPAGAEGAKQAAAAFDASGWQKGLSPDAWFDTGYYLSHNPDVAAAHVNPLLHYETFGWLEGRDPSAGFSTNGYLAAYSDVKAAGMDPLLHYVEFGRGEGRSAVPV